MRLTVTLLALLFSLTSFAQTAEELKASGQQRYDQEDYAGARSAFDNAIALKKDDAELYILRGNARSRLKDSKGAIEDYSAAIAVKPSARAYHNRGIVKKNTKDYDGAIADYTKAIATDPSYKYAYQSRALLLTVEKEDNKAALADLEKYIQLEPGDAEGYSLSGVVRGRLGDNKNAIADFTKALELDSKNTDVYYYRGVLEMREQQQAAACADLAQAVKAGFEITDKAVIDFMKKCPKGRTYIVN